MTDAARTLLVACVLSASAGAAFVWRLRQFEPDSHARLISELRAANAAAILLAATGASTIGFAIVNATAHTAALEMALALLFVGAAAALFFRTPREALALAAVAFVAHALLDLAHRPGGLSTDVIPRWYLIGCALYDGCIAGLCFAARQRS